jgi:hypothetical protein
MVGSDMLTAAAAVKIRVVDVGVMMFGLWCLVFWRVVMDRGWW